MRFVDFAADADDAAADDGRSVAAGNLGGIGTVGALVSADGRAGGRRRVRAGSLGRSLTGVLSCGLAPVLCAGVQPAARLRA